MEKITRSMIPALLVSIALLICGAQCGAVYAQDNQKKTRTSVACGKQIKKQCTGVQVAANNILECVQRNEGNLSARCAALAVNVVRMCDRDAGRFCQGVVASPQGNIIGCLTMSKRVVSSRCNAALDAASLR